MNHDGLYLCDPEKNVKCRKTSCQKTCFHTTFEEYAAESEPMSDSISRQAAITLPVMPKEHREYQTQNLDDAYEQGWLDLQKCIENLPSAHPEIIRCKDCKHRPTTNDAYDSDELDCGYNIDFPDNSCPCQCDDGYYNRLPDDDWFCGNAER